MPLPTGGDFDLDAGLAGILFRQELNAIILALLSSNASASLPPETVAFMFRAALDTSPNELQIRNPANSSFLKVAEVTDTGVKLFSDGGAVPSLGVAQTFTEAQTVDLQSTAGLFSVGSDLSAGVVARIPMFGHNSAASNVNGVNLVCRVNTNTAGVEDFTFEVEVIRGGSASTVAALGSITDFRRSGGGGTLDADIIRQAGVTLDTILSNETGRLGADPSNPNFGSARILAQADEGQLLRYNGAGNVTVTVPRLAQNTVVFLVNEGTGDITFSSDTAPNDVEFRTSRLTLPTVGGQSPMCALTFFLSTGSRVNINGQNI